MYPENVQVIGELLPEHSQFTTGNWTDIENRWSSHDPGNHKAWKDQYEDSTEHY
jgi:hypothetical protein